MVRLQSERLATSELRAPMPSRFRRVFSSSVGTKLLMGLTGLALFGWFWPKHETGVH